MKGMDLQKKQDWTSRKYRTSWILTIIFLVLLVAQSITSLLLTVFWGELVFTILPVEAFVALVMMIWAAYFGSNVAEKHKSFKSKTIVTELSDIVEDEGNDAGGQPEESIGNEP